MSPAKATRPGFRHSLSGTYSDAQKSDYPAINLFHPVYHSYTNHIGSRIDVEREWPVRLQDEDTEDLIDAFSEPPQFVERLSPVSVMMGEEVYTGRNWTDLMIKIYRESIDLFGGIGRFIDSSLRQGRGEAGRIPFMSLAIDPDTIHRIIETDYETGEATYASLIKLFAEGHIAPCLTTPFHALMPLLSDSEIRLCARISFIFYQRILKKYHEFLKKQGEDGLFVVGFWAPECAFHTRLEAILREEFAAFCKAERLGKPHLVFMLDSEQAEDKEYDVLMKSWNLLDGGEKENGRNGSRKKPDAKGELHPGIDDTSIVFRDRSFSDWVVYANPSVKKLLDRTIAKVDSDLNRQEIHYGWAHFEEIESLAHTPRSVQNFKQKLVKLTELGYVPLSPDFYVRGKLRGQLGYAENEPRRVRVHQDSASSDWLPLSGSFARWLGVKKTENNGAHGVLDHKRFTRNTEDGTVEDEGPQCWKIAWKEARAKCIAAAVGDLEALKGGVVEVLADMVGVKDAATRRERVMDFLAAYTHVYWREHFIQHDLSEADINIHEMANERLRANSKSRLSEADAAIAGACAQAIFFALDSGRSGGTRYENCDQRALYQNVVMLTLALCNAVYVQHWLGEPKKGRAIVDLIKTELIGFHHAYERYGLSKYGVKRKCWEQALAPHIDDSKENVVARAASRVAASHLRRLGYTREFSRDDELKTVNVGHLWSTEMTNINYKYENPIVCGVSEA